MIDLHALRRQLATAAPTLWLELNSLARAWVAPILDQLTREGLEGKYPKTVNDPIWGVIELYPWETLFLDSPLLQPLRGVRQLGMAQLVYPSAAHDRLEHSRGVVEASERMIRALERNARHRRQFGPEKDEHVPLPSEQDRIAIRLAALLHDLGHGPFSHATEGLLRACHADEFKRAEDLLLKAFAGATKVATSEAIAVLVILSEPMRDVFAHERFAAGGVTTQALPGAIAARILGSRACLDAGYLSGVISGPIDADKLDYMARDCHHAGLPLGLDITRLISKLEVVIVTAENAPNPELRQRAEQAQRGRFYEMGISSAGLGAYEQMIIGRVILYDRLYHHHKVRAAEAMIRRLIEVAQEELGRLYTLAELLADHSDDAVLAILGGELRSERLASGQERAKDLSRALLERRIYHRAYAFAARFLDGLSGLPSAMETDTRAYTWSRVFKSVESDTARAELAGAIYEKARALDCVADLTELAAGLRPEHVLVDLPKSKVAVGGGNILTRTPSGHVGLPNLFFNPDRWSQAYEQQKQNGFIFAPREFVPLVALASRIVFYERFQVRMSPEADQAAKTHDLVQPQWIEQAREAGVCSLECATALASDSPRMAFLWAEELVLPEAWRAEDPGLAKRLEEGFREALPAGLPAPLLREVANTIQHLAAFITTMERTGYFVGKTDISEHDLQAALKSHFSSREVEVLEGPEWGGGETDLLLPGNLVIENKLRGDTADPFGVGPHYAWQNRRYSIAVCSRIGIVVLGYHPTSERAIPTLPERIRIAPLEGSPEDRAQIRVVVPYGHAVPHDARSPVAPARAKKDGGS